MKYVYYVHWVICDDYDIIARGSAEFIRHEEISCRNDIIEWHKAILNKSRGMMELSDNCQVDIDFYSLLRKEE